MYGVQYSMYQEGTGKFTHLQVLALWAPRNTVEPGSPLVRASVGRSLVPP